MDMLRHNSVLTNLPFGYALHKMVLNDAGEACDYEYIEINDMFEKQTGLLSDIVIGKTVTEVIPTIKDEEFDWIGTYATVAFSEKTLEFEEFSSSLDKWYSVTAYSPQKGYFITLTREITEEKKQAIKQLETEQLLKQQQYLMDIYKTNFANIQEFVAHSLGIIMELSSCEYADIWFLNEETELCQSMQCVNSYDKLERKIDNIHAYQTTNKESKYELALLDTNYPSTVLAQPSQIEILSKDLARQYVSLDTFVSIPIMFEGTLVAVLNLANFPNQYPSMNLNHLVLFMQRAWMGRQQKFAEKQMNLKLQKLGEISNKIGVLIAEFLPDTTITYVNDAFCVYFGKKAEELVGEQFLTFMPLDERETIKQRYMQLTTESPTTTQTYPVFKKDAIRWMEWQDSAVFDGEGRITSWYSIGFDVTEKKMIQDEKDKQLQQLNEIIYGLTATILIIDPTTAKIIDANNAAVEFYGYSKEEFLKLTIEDISTNEPEIISEHLRKLYAQKQKKLLVPHRLKDGTIKVVELYASPIVYEDEEYICSIIFDATDREEAKGEMIRLAFYDYLTGVYNRRYLENEYKKLNKITNYPLAIIRGDINGMRLINDFMGYHVGDKLLVEVAKRIHNCINSEHILARIGGDEFAILLTHCSKEDIKQLIKRLEQMTSEEFFLEYEPQIYMDVPISTSISFGYAMQKNAGVELGELLTEAETYVNRRKFFDNKSMKSTAIKAILNALFEKSMREERHSKRVGLICEAIAKELEWDDGLVNKVRVAGTLHDIGKIGVSDNVLNKTARLNKEEWKEMVLHVEKGARILESTVEYKVIADIVRYHHERYDGTGYPSQLKGEEIPIESRMIAVADAYDAMIGRSFYQIPKTEQEAVAELKQCAGTHFDPHIVEVFTERVLKKNKFHVSDIGLVCAESTK